MYAIIGVKNEDKFLRKKSFIKGHYVQSFSTKSEIHIYVPIFSEFFFKKVPFLVHFSDFIFSAFTMS